MPIRNSARASSKQPDPSAQPLDPLPPFDFDDLAPKGMFGRLFQRLTERLIPAFLWLARELRPVPKAFGFYWIVRNRDVLAALEAADLLGVPYGPEMRELGRGDDGKEADFVLGVDGPAQQRQNAIIRRILLAEDLDRTSAWGRGFAEALVEGGGGRLDVVTDFAVRIPTEICRRYFGLSIADPNAFADWSIAVSATLFADPGDDPAKRRLGLAGAKRLCRVIDRAIERAKGVGRDADFAELTLVERLVRLQGDEPELGLDHAECRAIILGLVTGFIPTNGLAAAKMIEELARNRRGWAAAVAAAQGEDREAMRKVVLEAGRLNPALAPGQWRRAAKPVRIGRGRRARVIPAGALVMVSTMSAMRDRRAYRKPGRFDADAGNDAELVFGFASHKCLGQHLAVGIIAEMFLVLFRQPGLRRAAGRFGKMQRAGYFPRRLDFEYQSFTGTQSMIVSCIPTSLDRSALEAEIAALGNPAREDVRKSLDGSGIVHFASATAVNAGDGEDGPLFLVLELNVDGPRDRAIDRLAGKPPPWLADFMARAVPGDGRTPAEIIRAHALDLHFRPWGTTGLNFFGTGDFPVASIEKQASLRRRVEEELSRFLARPTGLSEGGLEQRAMAVLTAVRRAIRADGARPEVDAFLVQPSRKVLPLSRWRKPAHYWAPVRHVLRGGLGAKLALAGVFTGLLCLLLIDYALRGGARGFFDHIGQSIVALGSLRFDQLPALLSHGAVLLTLALFMTLLAWAVLGGFAYAVFRWMEAREQPDDRPPSVEQIAAVAARENSPGCRQNHITAVTPLKRGLVRRLALAFSLWGIRQSLHWFRPGHVVTMGTIHYAKWFRLPKSRKLIFQSNYDGSWESYLEDFITRAHWGQTAAWSSGEGFPRSTNLIADGARDGDRFKRWVRRQQVPTLFWYSRFPELTTDDIRTNALIHDGLARATTDTDARAWLDLLGSAQRQPYELESMEIQSLVFRGLKRALFTACIPVLLPDTKLGRAQWLAALLAQLSFGKFPEANRALYIGLSPAGIRKLGRDAPQSAPQDILRAFPPAFAMGMANRHAVLGDPQPDDPEEACRWRDMSIAGRAEEDELAADAVLLLYAPTREGLEEDAARQEQLLAGLGGRVVHDVIRTAPVGKDGRVSEDPAGHFAYEHFGFRDGISTPVIRGTEKFSPRDGDLVEPGEFILGYANNQGYFAPGIMVPAGSDTGDNLPIAAGDTPFGFADFQGADGPFAPRDLGRNGTFLAIRQLAQDKAGFEQFVRAKAEELVEAYGSDLLRETVGNPVTPTWVAAKLMGRWQDGRPLVGNPDQHNRSEDRYPDNDFLYGRDDPRGHACPLGAHIRRANARDSMEPADPLEQMVTRRHLLIRRGRTYFRDTDGRYVTDTPEDSSAERGLLFVALCADLERQFEFVQQTWLGFPGFHGLSEEPDPIAIRSRAAGPRKFTIPTPSGPLILRDMQSFVSHHGGGYFFLPSRSAIRYFMHFGMPDQIEHLFSA